MKVKSKHQQFTELAMTGEDIGLHIQKFSELDVILEIVEPYGYKIKSISSYTGAEPNVILYQDLEKLRDNKINQILN
jgi:hypothetical protein